MDAEEKDAVSHRGKGTASWLSIFADSTDT